MNCFQNASMIFAFLIAIIAVASCKKESKEQIDYEHAMRNVKYTCADTITNWHFDGYLDDKKICYSNGVEDYIAQSASVNGFITYAPTINFNDPSTFTTNGSWFQFGFVQQERANFMDEFLIESPVDSFGTSLIHLVEKHLHFGELKIRDKDSAPEEGFNIKVVIPYSPKNDGGFYTYEKLSATGSQEGSKFVVTKLERSENTTAYIFDIEAELNCKLYDPFDVTGTGEFFGEITEGKLITRLSIPK